MWAEISWALNFLPSMSTDHDVPMWRFTDRMVRSGLVMAWRLATSPTRTSPDFENPTTDGVVRPPSALGMTTGSPASNTLTTQLVVPRAIPPASGLGFSSVFCSSRWLSPGHLWLLRVGDCLQYSDLESEPVNLYTPIPDDDAT